MDTTLSTINTTGNDRLGVLTMRTTSLTRLIPFTVLALLLAACGATAGDSVDTTLTQSTNTTTTPSTTTVSTTVPATTTTTVEPTTTTMAPADGGETVIRDIVYLEMDGHEYLVDVYIPDGDGPWPVVVALHGATVLKGHNTNTVVAAAAAEAGMLVVAPN